MEIWAEGFRFASYVMKVTELGLRVLGLESRVQGFGSQGL